MYTKAVVVLLIQTWVISARAGDVYTINSCRWCKLTPRGDISTSCSIGQSSAERGYNADCQEASHKFCHGPNIVQPGPVYHGCAVSRTVDAAKYPELCTYDDFKQKLSGKTECVCNDGEANVTSQEMIRGATCEVGDMSVEWNVTVKTEKEKGGCGGDCIVGVCLGLGFFAAIVTCLFYGMHRRNVASKSKAKPPNSKTPAAATSEYPIHPTGPVRHK